MRTEKREVVAGVGATPYGPTRTCDRQNPHLAGLRLKIAIFQLSKTAPRFTRLSGSHSLRARSGLPHGTMIVRIRCKKYVMPSRSSIADHASVELSMRSLRVAGTRGRRGTTGRSSGRTQGPTRLKPDSC